MTRMNALWNCKNPNQGDFKKVLCVCSAGLLRSPTIAYVMSQAPYNCNTRAAGVHDYALVPVDEVLLEWADEIVCADKEHYDIVMQLLKNADITGKDVDCLAIPDRYQYRSPKLIEIIKDALNAYEQ